MSDSRMAQELFSGTWPKVRPTTDRVPAALTTESEVGECAAFGFLRGLDASALALEFRFRNGNRESFSYNLLASWRFNPSAGLLLKFTSDLVTLVWIKGSNLDAPLAESGVNLIDRGLQRHRILWIREMNQDQVREAGEGAPTVDRIEVAEFESAEEMREWLRKLAPVFASGVGRATAFSG